VRRPLVVLWRMLWRSLTGPRHSISAAPATRHTACGKLCQVVLELIHAVVIIIDVAPAARGGGINM
jgi:hypothetical protein